MRYQVPQFVDIEDRIIGPLTLKQFLMYLTASFLLVPVYLFSDLSLFITIAIPVAGVAGLFAHFKINGRTLSEMISFAVQFYMNGQLYVWRRTMTLQVVGIYDADWEELAFARTAAKKELSALAATAQSLDAHGSVVDVDEADPLMSEEV